MGIYLEAHDMITEFEDSVLKTFDAYSNIYGIEKDAYELKPDRKGRVSFLHLQKRVYNVSYYEEEATPKPVYARYDVLGKFRIRHPDLFAEADFRQEFPKEIAKSLKSIEGKLKRRKEWAETFIREVESRAKNCVLPRGEFIDSDYRLGRLCHHVIVFRERYRGSWVPGDLRLASLFALGLHQATLFIYPESFFPHDFVLLPKGYSAAAWRIRRLNDVVDRNLSAGYNSLFLNVPYTKAGLKAAMDLVLYEGDFLDDYVMRGEESFIGRVLAFSEKVVEDPYGEVCKSSTRAVNDFFTHASRIRGM